MTKQVASGRSVEASGKTVEQAVESALTRLGRTEEQVEVTVLREASRGVLGFGAHDAIVRVTERMDDAQPTWVPAATPTPVVAETPQPVEAVVEADTTDDTEPAEASDTEEDFESDDRVDDHREPHHAASTAPREEVLEIGRDILVDILQRMSVYGDVLATWTEPQDEEDTSALLLEVVGDDLGLLIGRRGETLRDLQYLVRLIVAKRVGGSVNIVVDVEEYKARRERSLRQLARRTAERVLATGRSVHMEPMNSYERRIVHLELRQIQGVHTQSSGEGERRKVGIFPGNGKR